MPRDIAGCSATGAAAALRALIELARTRGSTTMRRCWSCIARRRTRGALIGAIAPRRRALWLAAGVRQRPTQRLTEVQP